MVTESKFAFLGKNCFLCKELKNIRQMTRDEILKLKAVTLYILKQCGGELDFIHLFKILYFAERRHYATYGKHLVADTFCAMERGPVPSFLYDAVKVTTGFSRCTDTSTLRLISSALAPVGGECCHYIVRALEDPDMDELSRAAIVSLNKSISENQHKDARQLSTESHDKAWEEAWNNKHASPMNSISIAKAGGAKDGFASYIAEQEKLDRYLAD